MAPITSKVTIREALFQVRHHYRIRKQEYEPDLRVWEFMLQMICSAYLSWRWLGRSARFAPFRPSYWVWLACYSSLSELATRAMLADEVNRETRRKQIIHVRPGQKFIQVEWPNRISTKNLPPASFWKRS
jgi:hypothetical protein